MSTVGEQLGRTIARHRIAQGLTQAQLSERVGIQPETVSRMETGRTDASLKMIARVADALELDLYELFRSLSADTPKGKATERMHLYASRLNAREIDLMVDTGAVAVQGMREAVKDAVISLRRPG